MVHKDKTPYAQFTPAYSKYKKISDAPDKGDHR